MQFPKAHSRFPYVSVTQFILYEGSISKQVVRSHTYKTKIALPLRLKHQKTQLALSNAQVSIQPAASSGHLRAGTQGRLARAYGIPSRCHRGQIIRRQARHDSQHGSRLLVTWACSWGASLTRSFHDFGPSDLNLPPSPPALLLPEPSPSPSKPTKTRNDPAALGRCTLWSPTRSTRAATRATSLAEAPAQR